MFLINRVWRATLTHRNEQKTVIRIGLAGIARISQGKDRKHLGKVSKGKHSNAMECTAIGYGNGKDWR